MKSMRCLYCRVKFDPTLIPHIRCEHTVPMTFHVDCFEVHKRVTGCDQPYTRIPATPSVMNGREA